MLKREVLLTEADAIIRKGGVFSKEDTAKVDSLLRLADAIPDDTRDVRAVREQRSEPSSSEYASKFVEYIRSGEKHVVEDLRKIHQRYTPQVTSTVQGGGALVPAAFASTLNESMIATDPIFEAATLVPTDTGTAFSHPTLDDRQEAAIVAENGPHGDGVTVLNAISWDAAPKWSTGLVLAPVELIQDSAFEFESVLARIYGKRYARGIGKYFIQNIIANASSPLTSASATSISGDEVLGLMGSVNSDYAARGSWLMNFSTLIAILKLKGSTGGSYLFEAQVAPDGKPLLLGRPVLLSPSMPDVASEAVALAFGDVSAFLHRSVRNSLRVHVAKEQYIESGQIGYVGTYRCDGQLVLSNDGSPVDTNSPIKTLTQKA
jgi:HK97 family phage major capsid protein